MTQIDGLERSMNCRTSPCRVRCQHWDFSSFLRSGLKTCVLSENFWLHKQIDFQSVFQMQLLVKGLGQKKTKLFYVRASAQAYIAVWMAGDDIISACRGVIDDISSVPGARSKCVQDQVLQNLHFGGKKKKIGIPYKCKRASTHVMQCMYHVIYIVIVLHTTYISNFNWKTLNPGTCLLWWQSRGLETTGNWRRR